MTPLTASEALMPSRIATSITVDLIAVSALSGRALVGSWCRDTLPLTRNGMVRSRYPRRGAGNSSMPGCALRRGREGHDKMARERPPQRQLREPRRQHARFTSRARSAAPPMSRTATSCFVALPDEARCWDTRLGLRATGRSKCPSSTGDTCSRRHTHPAERVP
jgi:hypothetical protein